ncbi:AAA family ATPase [Aerococcus urinaeequi]|uniref:AAA family ATPase n=1 Tax=Aerococcus urinaeequi TaxID=51665 RepID=A0AAE9XNR4_9LACT|nr:AAA family ATPase [Aerococcus urinaeequi]WCG38575.1 AAA family ATPase [Aerococcus urinaeequi]
MINKLIISNIASFDSDGIKIADLNKINYIYGGNGVGKTTISNYINSLTNTKTSTELENEYSNCSSDYNSEEKIFVYNQKFSENVIVEKQIPGIFSLGENAKLYEEQLEEYKKSKINNEKKLENANHNLIIAKDELANSKNKFIDYLWRIYRDKESELYSVFNKTAFYNRNNKQKFYEQYQNDKKDFDKLSPQLSIDELINRTEKVYDTDLSQVSLISEFKLSTDTLDFDIFKEEIIGTENIDFSEMINSLNIQDWVAKGTDIIEENHMTQCPMCQRELTDNIVANLKNYFDSTYTEKIEILNKSVALYKNYYSELRNLLVELKENDFLSRNSIVEIELEAETINNKNEKILESKLVNPSTKQEIENFDDVLDNLRLLIKNANSSIEDHNKIVNNRSESKQRLIKEVKINFFKLANKYSKEHYEGIETNQKKVNGININIEKVSKSIKEIDTEVEKIKNKISGIEFTVSDINKQLQLFGFYNFKVKVMNETSYSLIRENGDLVSNNLSEGEKTFISFLYFYHTIIKDKDSKKIIVIDDPISSLDSSILYVVSSIIKQLVKKKENLNIDQLIISTHNTYFFKEITYKSDNNLTNYYILRKNKGISYIKKYKNNPINSSYELLWKELKEAKEKPNSSVPNIMRRILEEYFTFLGNKKLDELVQAFDEEEQIIADSLIKFSHDGTHRIKDDLYVEQTGETYEKFYYVFEELFKKNNQHSHYQMMKNSVGN